MITDNNKGNALFLILIAVALFAALSYAVTQSGRGGGGISRETQMINAAQMVQYVGGLRTTAQRMMITGGTTAATLDLHGAQPYQVCTTGAHCVFAAEGGGATSMQIPNIGSADQFGDRLWRYSEVSDGFAVTGIGTTAADAMVFSYISVNPEGQALCQHINDKLGITGIPGSASGPDWWAAASGVPIACVRHYNAHFIFYTVLIEN